MTARQLVRFYPRAWQARYGEEFVEVIGNKGLSAQQVIDILAGAVDAWMSPTVRASVRGHATGGNGGATMIHELKMKCATPATRYTKRDALISAGVLIGLSALMSVAGIAAKRNGFEALSEFILAVAFPASVLVSMPFAITKGQSWRAQAVFIGAPLAIVVAMTWFAVVINS